MIPDTRWEFGVVLVARPMQWSRGALNIQAKLCAWPMVVPDPLAAVWAYASDTPCTARLPGRRGYLC